MLSEKGLPVGDVVGRNLFDGSFPLPVAVLDNDAVEHNLATMAGYCAAHGVLLAPHGKTTMCDEIISRQVAAGAWAITVATVWQAETVAAMGVPRLLLANQVTDRGSLRRLAGVVSAYPGMEVFGYVDSVDSLLLLEASGAEVKVLVELGIPNGRTGLRDDDAALALAREVAAGPLELAGVAGFEGIILEPELAAALSLVDDLVWRMVRLARSMHDEALLDSGILTVGGSSFFDRVIAIAPEALRDKPFQVVLRSGCYVTHDAGIYDILSPFGSAPRDEWRLREALHVWGAVLSRPEPGLALAGLGRRDASADAGLPVPRFIRDANGMRTADAGLEVTAVNDQHAYLTVPDGMGLAVGDLIGFGISHPCTTFDKWKVIPLVDAEHNVVGLARTHF